MKLGADFTKALLAALRADGQRPALTDEPDLEPFVELEILAHRVWITPLKLKPKGWIYRVRDFRANTVHMSATLSVPGDEFSTITGAHRETEPEQIHAAPSEGVTLSQLQQRSREKKIRLEARLNDARKRGKVGRAKNLANRLRKLDRAA